MTGRAANGILTMLAVSASAVAGVADLRDVGTGIVVTPDGVVLAPARFSGCEHIDATLAGKTMHARMVAEEAALGLLVLRLPGHSFAPVAPRATPAGDGDAVTLVGETGTQLGAAAGNLVLAPAPHDPASIQAALHPSSTMTDGMVLDTAGAVVGLAVRQADGAGSRRRLVVVPVLALQAALEHRGWRWAGETPVPPDLRTTMQHAVAATVRLACFGARSP